MRNNLVEILKILQPHRWKESTKINVSSFVVSSMGWKTSCFEQHWGWAELITKYNCVHGTKDTLHSHIDITLLHSTKHLSTNSLKGDIHINTDINLDTREARRSLRSTRWDGWTQELVTFHNTASLHMLWCMICLQENYNKNLDIFMFRVITSSDFSTIQI